MLADPNIRMAVRICKETGHDECVLQERRAFHDADGSIRHHEWVDVPHTDLRPPLRKFCQSLGDDVQ